MDTKKGGAKVDIVLKFKYKGKRQVDVLSIDPDEDVTYRIYEYLGDTFYPGEKLSKIEYFTLPYIQSMLIKLTNTKLLKRCYKFFKIRKKVGQLPDFVIGGTV